MPTVAEAAQRLAELLSGAGNELSDPTGSDLDFFPEVHIEPLVPQEAPVDCWAVDGGQALVADARFRKSRTSRHSAPKSRPSCLVNACS